MRLDANGWLDAAQEVDYTNKAEGREGFRPLLIVLHGTAGGSSAQGVATWFATGGESASAHIIIDQAGNVVQGVPCSLAAWGNGIINKPRITLPYPGVNPNLYTISIEHVKPHLDNSDALTVPQKRASFQVIAALCDQYGIPKRRGDQAGGIIEHADIDSVSREHCPGPYPWAELWTFLAGGQQMTPNKWQIADAEREWKSTAGLFPVGQAPAYTSGIAAAWRNRIYSGQRIGPPITNEYDSTDWGGNPIRVQQFTNARCEWRIDGSSCRFFDSRGEL